MRDFAARECGTHEQREAHEEGTTPRSTAGSPSSAGSASRSPRQYGGGGGSVVDLCLLLEETTRGLLPIGAMAVSLIVAGAVERFGTEEQKHEILGGSPAASRTRSRCPSPRPGRTSARCSAAPSAATAPT